MSTAIKEIVDYVRANFPVIWVHTYDSGDLLGDLAKECGSRRYSLVVFDRDYGVTVHPTFGNPLDGTPGRPGADSDGVAQLCQEYVNNAYKNEGGITTDSQFMRAISRLDDLSLNEVVKKGIEYDSADMHTTLFVHMNPHHDVLMTNPLVLQVIENIAKRAKSTACDRNRIAYIPLGPVTNIPEDLKYDITKVEYPLPKPQELMDIAVNLTSDISGVEPLVADLENAKTQAIVESGAGLNRKKFEDAVSLSIVKHNDVRPSVIWDEKRKLIQEFGFLTLYEGTDSFDEVGGTKNYQEYTRRLLSGSKKTGIPTRGQVLVGIPGGGKTKSAKCLANETSRYLFMLDLATARSKWMGESNRNVAKAIEIVEAMQPSILFIDEVDKAFSGAGVSSSITDGGTGDRILSQFLTWLNDHTSDVFVVFTANNVSNLPGEFLRNGRFDGIFFFDLPTVEERKQIWDIHIRRYFKFSEKAMEGALGRINALARASEDWTGADIEAACRQAAILQTDIMSAVDMIVPLSKTRPERIAELREEAKGRYLSANTSGIYEGNKSVLTPFKVPKHTKGSRNIENN